jgi:hypothetical protein
MRLARIRVREVVETCAKLEKVVARLEREGRRNP